MEHLHEYVKLLNSRKTFPKGVDSLLPLVQDGDLDDLQSAGRRMFVVLQSRSSSELYWSRGLEFFLALDFRRSNEETATWVETAIKEVDEETRTLTKQKKAERTLQEQKAHNGGMFADQFVPITRGELLQAFNLVEAEEARPAMSRDARYALPVVTTDKDDVCPVCQEELPCGSKAKQMPCGHLFHHVCLMSWLETANSCPTCRGSDLPSEKVRLS
eukprot:GEMP01080602.1.p1 GENE.GEMP01080602.1~~GEMP01080602.1.p1  ORF type:complete len:216 (+),score=41.06 GEMP01080602.1:120-767(+)